MNIKILLSAFFLLQSLLLTLLSSTPLKAVAVVTLTPYSGPVGTSVTILGEVDGMGNAYDIYWDTTDGAPLKSGIAPSTSKAITETFTVPESSKGRHSVILRDKITGGKGSGTFTVTPAITINPNSGKVGTTVTISGTGFNANERNIQVLYDGSVIKENITANASGNWSATFTVPESAKGAHIVDVQGEETAKTEVPDRSFTVTPALSINPSSGTVKSTVTVNGTGFSSSESDIRITYNTIIVKADIKAAANGSWSANFEVPASTKGPHTVTAFGIVTREAEVPKVTFTVTTQIILTPNEGNIGSEVTVSGSGFAAGKAVTLTYDGNPLDTVPITTDSNGSFAANFKAPKSKSGPHTVVATDATGNSATTTFIMERTPPPVPELVSPPQGGKVRATVTLEWSSVSDPSGVSYILQIDDKEDFLTLILNKADLAESEYTLIAKERLPRGTYFWRVKAVDGAGNESNWSEPRSFSVGIQLWWGFILIPIVLLLLIGLIYFVVAEK